MTAYSETANRSHRAEIGLFRKHTMIRKPYRAIEISKQKSGNFHAA
jgi:hypothetical protein